jgi:hypothetical protein
MAVEKEPVVWLRNGQRAHWQGLLCLAAFSGGMVILHCCCAARRSRRSRCQTRSMARRHAREQKRWLGERRCRANPW